jgi:hypothetical protein
MPRFLGRLLAAGLLLIATASAFAQQRKGNDCTLAGVWYGGSAVSYLMTVTPTGSAGHYTVVFEGMFKNAVMNTNFNMTLKNRGKKYEGSGVALMTKDPAFLNPPPLEKMPDLIAGWFSMQLVDCNTIKNTIPFLGYYFGPGIWQPGTETSGVKWVAGSKVPLLDPPDIDVIPILTGGPKPIVETYHRLPTKVNRNLLHTN